MLRGTVLGVKGPHMGLVRAVAIAVSPKQDQESLVHLVPGARLWCL